MLTEHQKQQLVDAVMSLGACNDALSALEKNIPQLKEIHAAGMSMASKLVETVGQIASLEAEQKE